MLCRFVPHIFQLQMSYHLQRAVPPYYSACIPPATFACCPSKALEHQSSLRKQARDHFGAAVKSTAAQAQSKASAEHSRIMLGTEVQWLAAHDLSSMGNRTERVCREDRSCMSDAVLLIPHVSDVIQMPIANAKQTNTALGMAGSLIMRPRISYVHNFKGSCVAGIQDGMTSITQISTKISREAAFPFNGIWQAHHYAQNCLSQILPAVLFACRF